MITGECPTPAQIIALLSEADALPTRVSRHQFYGEAVVLQALPTILRLPPSVMD